MNSIDEITLIEKAFEARLSSYAPYSGFNVGAAVLCGDGDIICGANIENASYGATICAERCAIFKAVSEGKSDFRAIAICGGPRDETETLSQFTYPCGICRQVMREFADPKSFLVVVAKSKDDYTVKTLEELLPDSFGPDNLK